MPQDGGKTRKVFGNVLSNYFMFYILTNVKKKEILVPLGKLV